MPTKRPQMNDASLIGSRALRDVPFCMVPESVMFGVRTEWIVVLYPAISGAEHPT